MLSFTLNQVLPIGSESGITYKAIANDGLCFYLAAINRQIVKCDKCFQILESYNVARNYISLSYDLHLNCFWAVSEDINNKVFKLNNYFVEIGCILVDCPELQQAQISSVTASPDKEKLIISISNAFFCIIKTPSSNATLIEVVEDAQCIPATLADCLYYMGVTDCKTCQNLVVYDSCNQLSLKCCFSGDFYINAMTKYLVKPLDQNHIHLCLLANRACNQSCIVLCTFSSPKICDNTSSNCIPSFPPCDDKRAYVDIIESVALMEASLAHILNAEGEKIQKAVATSDDICKLLDINASVTKTINSVTHLEQVLLSKLELAAGLCSKDKDCDCFD